MILVIFIAALLAIMSERVNDTATALLALAISAFILFTSNGISFSSLLSTMGWDIILFIAAMMIIVSVVGASGLFQYTAVVLAHRTGGQLRQTYLYLLIVVFVLSLFFDPLPTMLIVSPVTVEVCNAIDADFRPFLVSEVVVANVASFPSPIGSVTNLVIVYIADINSGLMILGLMPLTVILFGITIWYMLRYYKNELQGSEERELTDLFSIDPRTMMKSHRDFFVSIISLGALVIGLVLLPDQGAIIALVIATMLLILSGEQAKKLLQHLSWDTVFFLLGLIGVVQAMVLAGVIDDLTLGFQWLIGDNTIVAIILMLWIPGALMAPVDAKAVGVLLAPIAGNLDSTNPIIPLSLTIGTNAGGYVVPFGDAPNVVVVRTAEKHLKPLSWSEFNRAVIPLGIVHLIISTVYCALLSLFFL
ncbi:MAG: SLC13 family permease [Candidatus Thorarchaeota archaeon]